MERKIIELMAHTAIIIIMIHENTGIKVAVPVVGIINEASAFEKRNVKFGDLVIRNLLIRMRNVSDLNGNYQPPYHYCICGYCLLWILNGWIFPIINNFELSH